MPESIAIQFGKNLRRARKHSVGLSQEELAVLASIHRTEVGLLERGERTPRIDTAVKLAGALGVPIDDLIEGINWQPGSVERGGFNIAPAERQDAR
jgi:transcriptional regulator with XRE-family HTH domain